MYKNFKYDEIIPGGWLKRQLEIQARGLAGNLDKMWPDVRDSAWIGGDKEGWERVPYWLDGFVPLAFLLRDEDMIARAKKYLFAIMDGQKPDGWICPCEDDRRGEYDVWALFLICKVLAEYGVYAGDVRALECTKNALYNLYTRMKEGSTKLRQWGKFRWFEALIPLKMVKERFDCGWEGELAAMLEEQGANYADFKDDWKTPIFFWRIQTHIVNLSMMLKTEAEMLGFSGRKYTDSAQDLYHTLFKYNGTAVGLITGDECLAGISPVAGTELCAVVELMYSCERLFALTGDAKWADLLERVAFNALPADERRESEIVGFLSYLGGAHGDDGAHGGDDGRGGDGECVWRCVGVDGCERRWRTRALLVPSAALDAFLADARVEEVRMRRGTAGPRTQI